MDDTINKLTEHFTKFPGIGSRQAKRFVYYLLRQNKTTVDDLAELLKSLKKDVRICSSCYRYFSSSTRTLCTVCSNTDRSAEVLMVVEKDIDIDNIERSSVFSGKYFVLGGTVSLLDKIPEKNIRSKELLALVKKQVKEKELKEIVLALSATPEGEETGNYISTLLEPITKDHDVIVSQLGRGLSTGSELEYSDSETIKNAFARRT